MKISRLLQVLFVSMFVAGPALAEPLSLCGGDKAEKAEAEKAKAEKKAEKAEKEKDAVKKVASKDSV
jgi:hypothetical protein